MCRTGLLVSSQGGTVANKIKKEKKDWYSLFKDYFKQYVVEFGLTDFEYHFSKVTMDDRATVLYDMVGRVVRVSFACNKEWSEAELKRTAFHEVCEVVLSYLSGKLDDYANSEIVQELAHAAILRLEYREFGFGGCDE